MAVEMLDIVIKYVGTPTKILLLAVEEADKV